MKLTVCAIYDQAAKAYLRPIFVTVVGMAIRTFQDEINNPKSAMFLHPEHYTLFEIGTYDDNSGEMVSISPVSHGNGRQYKDISTDMSHASVVDLVSVLKDEIISMRRVLEDIKK